MANPLAAKLRHFAPLSLDEITILNDLCANVRAYDAKSDLIVEGDKPDVVFLLFEGWGCRYKVLPDGKRQIMAYLIPGDLCDVHIFILRQMDQFDRPAQRRPCRAYPQGTDTSGLRGASAARPRALVVDADRRGRAARMARQHRAARRL